jgi:hypothetical protein
MAMPHPSLESLFAAPDPADLVVGLVDYVGGRIASGDRTIGPAEWAVRDVWLLEAEVYNGGFHQFFFNSAGDRAAETVDSLALIGAHRTAELVARANAMFGAPPSRDREERSRQLQAMDPAGLAALAELDLAFWAAPEPLTELLAAHCRAHHEAFVGEP